MSSEPVKWRSMVCQIRSLAVAQKSWFTGLSMDMSDEVDMVIELVWELKNETRASTASGDNHKVKVVVESEWPLTTIEMRMMMKMQIG